MALSAVERLKRFYDCFSNDDHVLILINADPDAMGSAMAVKRLLWRKTSGCVISHINTIKRPDNLAMIQMLDLPLIPVSEINPADFSRFVIVDSQPNHHELFMPFDFNVIIDHHPVTEENPKKCQAQKDDKSCKKQCYKDIRPAYGAVASMMTEYLRAAKIKPSAKLATALFYAIKTDTSNFERSAINEDVRAFQFLFKHTNIQLARRIEQANIRLDFLKYFKIALNEMVMRKNRIYVHVGQVVSPDVLVLIADFFMRVITVQWSIVCGICGNTLIIIFRNDGLRKSAGKVAQKAFGTIGSAGGHKSMARAELCVDDVEQKVNAQDNKLVLKWIVEKIEKKADKKQIVKFEKKWFK